MLRSARFASAARQHAHWPTAQLFTAIARPIDTPRPIKMSQQREAELLALPYRELQALAKEAGVKASG